MAGRPKTRAKRLANGGGDGIYDPGQGPSTSEPETLEESSPAYIQALQDARAANEGKGEAEVQAHIAKELLLNAVEAAEAAKWIIRHSRSDNAKVRQIQGSIESARSGLKTVEMPEEEYQEIVLKVFAKRMQSDAFNEAVEELNLELSTLSGGKALARVRRKR